MKILDKEIDFDLNDAETIDKIQKIAREYDTELKNSNTLTEACNTYRKFFDTAIGEGTSNSLFGEKNNYMDIITAYNQIIEVLANKLDEFEQIKNQIAKKYERYQ